MCLLEVLDLSFLNCRMCICGITRTYCTLEERGHRNCKTFDAWRGNSNLKSHRSFLRHLVCSAGLAFMKKVRPMNFFHSLEYQSTEGTSKLRCKCWLGFWVEKKPALAASFFRTDLWWTRCESWSGQRRFKLLRSCYYPCWRTSASSSKEAKCL